MTFRTRHLACIRIPVYRIQLTLLARGTGAHAFLLNIVKLALHLHGLLEAVFEQSPLRIYHCADDGIAPRIQAIVSNALRQSLLFAEAGASVGAVVYWNLIAEFRVAAGILAAFNSLVLAQFIVAHSLCLCLGQAPALWRTSDDRRKAIHRLPIWIIAAGSRLASLVTSFAKHLFGLGLSDTLAALLAGRLGIGRPGNQYQGGQYHEKHRCSKHFSPLHSQSSPMMV
jgi:hypothetical protein